MSTAFEVWFFSYPKILCNVMRHFIRLNVKYCLFCDAARVFSAAVVGWVFLQGTDEHKCYT